MPGGSAGIIHLPPASPRSTPVTDVVVQHDLPVPMRDGVLLKADVYRPSGPGRYPVVLQRTAYGKGTQTASGMLNALRAAEEGYAVVNQDSRGRYASD